MDVLSAKEMMAREEEAFRSGITAANLMEAAGEAMALRITALYPHARKFLVLVGKGNNGGDGLVVARHLASVGRFVQVVLTTPEDQLGELPRTQVDHLRRPFPNLEILTWHKDTDFPGSDGVVIDALLGIQARGTLHGVIAEVVAKLNTARAERFFRTVALDLPSGLAAYEEENPPKNRDIAVVADVALAVGFAKEVLCREILSGWVGRLEVVPWRGEKSATTPHQVLLGHELAGLLPRRNAFSHKNDFGRLAIIAGSTGFTGAPVLCAQAALAMGAGLISVVTRHEVETIVAAAAPPETMVFSWLKDGPTPEAVQMASAIVLGPGSGVNGQTAAMLRAVLARGCPVLIDADGLNILAQNLDLLREATGPVLLTPHPGEMSRLIKRKFTLDEREAVARAFADQYRVTLVLKGTRTLIAAPGQPTFINTTGNPGLSAGGSGDTLSGIVGALLAQGLVPLDAARLGVWLHGHAADLVLAGRGCEEGLTPTMLSAHLGAALVSLRAQAAVSPGLLERAKTFAYSIL
jgi:NAD(P)H-hydrate epimerase